MPSFRSWSFVLAVLLAVAPFASTCAGEAEKKEATKTEEKAPADAQKASVTGDTKAKPEGKKASNKEVTYFEEMVKKIEQGGWIVVVLMVLSVVGIGFALERANNLRRKSIAPEGFADQAHALWEKHDYQGLSAYCDKDASVLARIVRAIVDHRDCDVADVQTLAGDLGSREMRLHLQRAYPLAIIATLSPLLGLLGTVIGMIGAFDTVAAVGEMGDASILANDIAKALITTAAGLLVGIPTLGLYHLFKARTSSLAVLLEEETSEIINAWLLRPSRAQPQVPAPTAQAKAPAAAPKPAPAGAAKEGSSGAH